MNKIKFFNYTTNNQRRKVNISFDQKPSIHHKFNFKIAKPFITDKSILDVGCWTGQFEKLAIKEVKKLVGIDPNKKAINYAKKQVPKAIFKTGSVLKLSFPDNYFDTVLLLDVIEHLAKDSESQALLEIKRVLKPKGYLVLSTPNNHILSILFDPAFFLIGHRHYSSNELFKMLKKHNFSIVKLYKTGRLIRLISYNIELIGKHLLKLKIKQPKKIKQLIKHEYSKKGFAQLHIIAKNEK